MWGKTQRNNPPLIEKVLRENFVVKRWCFRGEKFIVRYWVQKKEKVDLHTISEHISRVCNVGQIWVVNLSAEF